MSLRGARSDQVTWDTIREAATKERGAATESTLTLASDRLGMTSAGSAGNEGSEDAGGCGPMDFLHPHGAKKLLDDKDPSHFSLTPFDTVVIIRVWHRRQTRDGVMADIEPNERPPGFNVVEPGFRVFDDGSVATYGSDLGRPFFSSDPNWPFVRRRKRGRSSVTTRGCGRTSPAEPSWVA